MKPKARDKDLVVRILDEEAVVYDFSTTRAHCLNRTALLVWQACDGRTSLRKLESVVGAQLGQPVDEEMVWLALDELSKAGLLCEPVEAPRVDQRRRQFLKKLGLTIAVPAVWSIIAPTPAYAASKVSCIPASGCMGAGAVCCGTSGSAAMSCSGGGLCTGSAAGCSGAMCI